MSLYLVTGPEQVLADRAIAQVVDDARRGAPDLQVVRIRPEGYQAGDLATALSPSLFGGDSLVVVHDLDEAPEALVEEVARYVAEPDPGIVLVVRHKGGNRGRRALDAVRKASAKVLDAPAVKKDADKAAFAMNEFRVAGRKAEARAVQMLVAAVGSDVAELANACAQLVADTRGVITPAVVELYHGGKVETTGFKVGEAAVAGNQAEALRLLRHALAGGLSPVAIVSNLASRLRQVGRVAAAGRGSNEVVAGQLSMAPWQVKAARAQAEGWDGYRLGRAIRAVAAADVAVKGGGRDPEYAVEAAVLAICRERHGR